MSEKMDPIYPGEVKKPIKEADGQNLKRLTEAGLTWLKTNQQIVNALNVFPVPDGDTGTNMVLTMQSAFEEVVDQPERHAGRMAQSIAHGALMGARGNSGVILSQIWRGFARSLDETDKIQARSMVDAFAAARDTAYKGVVRPVEGTILTVIKDIAKETSQKVTPESDLIEILEIAVQAADKSVKHTPELLSVLKEAKVVDAGGKGLYFILDGMLRYIYGLPLDTALTQIQPLAAMDFENTLEAIEPGQDYEIVMDFRPGSAFDLPDFFSSLEDMGTSIQIGEGDGMYRVHIHVPDEHLYTPITYAKSLGTVTKVAIENLMEQMAEIEDRNSSIPLSRVEPDQIAVVAVAPGPGIARVFASLGVAALVQGGQTMNPSTQEILNAFENLPTDKIIILPNNKNIILAAQSAAELTVKRVSVIPSRTVPQGLAAMLRLAPDSDFDDVVQEMTTAMEEVETGEITMATRTVEIDGVPVAEGQIIVLYNGKLIAAEDDLQEACIRFFENAHADDFELITMFYGNELTKPQVFRIIDELRKKYPQQEFEIQDGGQPHYFFIIGIE
ncbi:MAG: DAK2 domain-containing protein [Anaerolineales bacterium]